MSSDRWNLAFKVAVGPGLSNPWQTSRCDARIDEPRYRLVIERGENLPLLSEVHLRVSAVRAETQDLQSDLL
jgi:hypothetical protein